jgi:glycosyltransferase involved in cell wall biosynthesis
MALEKPIVVSRFGQLGELFEDGVTARLVPPGDSDELAPAVCGILESPDLGRELGRAARTVVEREHTWDDRGRLVLDRFAREAPASGVPAAEGA